MSLITTGEMKHTQTQRKWWGRSLQCRGSLWYDTLCVTDKTVSKHRVGIPQPPPANFSVYVSVIVHADVYISTVRDEAVADISLPLFLTRIVVVEWGSVSVWFCVVL